MCVCSESASCNAFPGIMGLAAALKIVYQGQIYLVGEPLDIFFLLQKMLCSFH
jgi:hypothetical protein